MSVFKESQSLEDVEQQRYQRLQEQEFRAWEARCHSCGMCCGVKEGDPCENLVLQEKGQYRCKAYQQRFGLHQTKSGRYFSCVPLRSILHEAWPGETQCAYKRMLKDFV